MLDVLCSDTELGEYGEVLAVGDRVERLASSTRGNFYGTGLDALEWSFERYAGLWTDRRSAMIAGDIVALAAIYVRMTRDPTRETGWIARPGSAWLEPLKTTADTRQPLERIVWQEAPSDARGRIRVSGHPVREENDEMLTGWRVTLEQASVTALEPGGD